MKKKGTKNLTYVQRLMLEDCLKAKLHKKVIAEKLGVCLATVYNEISRGLYQHKISKTDFWGDKYYKFVSSYSPEIAQEKYDFNQTSKGANIKLGNNYEFARFVEKRVLKDKISPCAVVGEIKKNNPYGLTISKTTMYRYISQGFIGKLTMSDCPFYKKKKTYRKPVPKRFSKGVSIEKRPEEVLLRNTFGHWEMDCVCGCTNSSLLVLTERLSRYELIFPIERQNCSYVVKTLNSIEKHYGKNFRKIFKSITVDNGSEFMDNGGIEKSIYRGIRTKVYYCHPYSSWERGSNERINRDIRRLVPKGTDLSKLSFNDVKQVEKWVNSYPREILDYYTSSDIFQNYVSSL